MNINVPIDMVMSMVPGNQKQFKIKVGDIIQRKFFEDAKYKVLDINVTYSYAKQKITKITVELADIDIHTLMILPYIEDDWEIVSQSEEV